MADAYPSERIGRNRHHTGQVGKDPLPCCVKRITSLRLSKNNKKTLLLLYLFADAKLTIGDVFITSSAPPYPVHRFFCPRFHVFLPIFHESFDNIGFKGISYTIAEGEDFKVNISKGQG